MFEVLPSELILDIFEYLTAIQLLRAFYNLNSRLNNIIQSSHKFYHLDFRSISKCDFDIIYQKNHQLIDNKIISIHLADDDETPNLPEIFFTQNFIVSNFNHLHSLSFYSIESLDLLNNILSHCSQLPQLTYLKFIQCSLNNAPDHIINNIWNCQKLITLSIHEDMSKGICFSRLSQISLSIKNLFIKNSICDIRYLSNIFKQTPYLQNLSTTISYSENDDVRNLPSLLHLTKLTLSFGGSIELLRNLFQKMINLRYLKFYTCEILLNGDQWKDILINYLPNLKKFEFKIVVRFRQDNRIENKIDELLNTFKTDFWINKHQWFVRCDWNSINPFNEAIIYTLPYAFQNFNFNNELYSKSTCPNKVTFWSYNQVKTLQYETKISNNHFDSPIKFCNLTHLDIILPYYKNFLLNIPSLTHLISLDVTLLPEDSIYDQLQILLDRATNLYLLRFSDVSDLDMRLFEIRNKSIRRLDFFNKESVLYNWYFNREECLALANSSLGKQCQTLVIDIKNRTNVIILINQMLNLQSLTFQCKDDKWNYKMSNDELIQWLKENLPSTYQIFRNKKQNSLVQIWIR